MTWLKLLVESVWKFQADTYLRHLWTLVILEKGHLGFIVILPLKEQVEMVNTSAILC